MDRWRDLVVTAANDKRPGTVRVSIRLTPKGGRDAIEGWRNDASGKRVLKARVAAPPEDGKANAALIALISETLDVPKSKVRIVAGGASRMKIVEIEGAPPLVTQRLSQARA
jgi:uncharacterized protein (TIGR00251 family)